MSAAHCQRLHRPALRLVAWYDAGTLALADGAAVSAWEDITRMSAGVAQGTGANQPIYKNNGTDNINSLPVVEFDGTNDVLSSAIAPTIRQSMTVFVVARSDTTVTSRALFSLGIGNPNRTCSLQVNGTGFLYYENGATTYNAFNAGYISNLTPYLVVIVKDRARVRTYVNGALRRSDIGQAALNQFSTLVLGSEGAGAYYNKHLAELRFYAGAMTDAERQAEEGRLNAKYALY